MRPQMTILFVTAREGYAEQVFEGARKVAEENQDLVSGFYHLWGEKPAMMVLIGLDHKGVGRFVSTNFGEMRGASVRPFYVKESFAPPFVTPQLEFWDEETLVQIIDQLSYPPCVAH